MLETEDPAETVRLEYRTSAGTPGTVIALGGSWVPVCGGLVQRPLWAENGSTLMLQRSVAHSDPGTQLLLENEIRAALRLSRRYGEGVPNGLPQLVGYNLETDQPYLLCGPPGGRPSTGLSGQLLLNQRHGFQTGLFRLLALLDAAGVVHAGIRPEAVCWDGSTVSLTGFHLAAVTGEPYRLDVASPWMPPSAGRQTIADPGDDVWAAGMVIAHVLTGQPAEQLPGSATADGSALASLLEGVFTGPPGQRPPAAQLLRRLGASVQVVPGPARTDVVLDAGRSAFDAERARKSAVADPVPSPIVEPVEPPRRRNAGLFVLAGLAMLGLVLLGWRMWLS